MDYSSQYSSSRQCNVAAVLIPPKIQTPTFCSLVASRLLFQTGHWVGGFQILDCSSMARQPGRGHLKAFGPSSACWLQSFPCISVSFPPRDKYPPWLGRHKPPMPRRWHYFLPIPYTRPQRSFFDCGCYSWRVESWLSFSHFWSSSPFLHSSLTLCVSRYSKRPCSDCCYCCWCSYRNVSFYVECCRAH